MRELYQCAGCGWLTESKSPTGVAGYFVTRGGSHRECIDKHIAREGVGAVG